jgi:ribosomal protein S18 acetylase RimI-like enzyme
VEELTIRNFVPDDIAAITAMQQAYAAAYPGTAIVTAHVYAGPGFDGGRNVFCAFWPDGRLAGYAPLYAVPAASGPGAGGPGAGAPPAPLVIWAEVRVQPGLADAEDVRERLFGRMLERAGALAALNPGRPCELTFQYLPVESPSIDFVVRKGAKSSESVFRMWRDLRRPLPAKACPPGIDVRLWRMESEAEQVGYIGAYNESFPEAPMALADWQYLVGSPLWAAGGAMAAFAGQELASSVTVYWDEEQNRRSGEQAGFTEYIFTRPAWRGRGIARCLIASALAYLREHGLEEARLEVRAHNEEALGLYRSLGYEVGQETKLYVVTLLGL